MMPARAALLLALALALPSGCSAVRSLNSAARPLDAYELVPAAIPGASAPGARSRWRSRPPRPRSPPTGSW